MLLTQVEGGGGGGSGSAALAARVEAGCTLGRSAASASRSTLSSRSETSSSSPSSSRRLHSRRRTLPLEVFGIVPASAITTSSTTSPTERLKAAKKVMGELAQLAA